MVRNAEIVGVKFLTTKTKLLGIILLIFGVTGILGCLFGLAAVWYSDMGASKVQGIINPIQDELSIMSKTMRDASIASYNAGVSIHQAKNTLDSASYSTELAARTIGDISEYVGFEIFGWRPFKETYYLFRETENNMNSLSYEIALTGQSLEQNNNDMKQMSTDFMKMSTQINIINQRLAEISDFNYWKMKKYLMLGIIYLGIVHLLFLLIGIKFMAEER
mgnify:CR=1 FL=1